MQNKAPHKSNLLLYFGAATSLLLIAHTVKMILADPYRQTPMFDLIGYISALAAGIAVMFFAVSLLLREEVERAHLMGNPTMKARMKLLTAISSGMLTSAGVMYLFLQFV